MKPLGLRFFGIALAVLTVFLAVSLVGYSPADAPDIRVFPRPETVENPCGPIGAFAASLLLNQFGLASWFLLIPLVFAVFRCLAGRRLDQPFLRTLGLGFMLLGLTGLLALAGAHPLTATLPLPPGPVIGPGGWLGVSTSFLLGCFMAVPGCGIFLVSLFVAGLILCGDRILLWLCAFLKTTERPAESLDGANESESSVKVPLFEELPPNSDIRSEPPKTETTMTTPLRPASLPGRMAVQASRGRTLEINREEEPIDFSPELKLYNRPSSELLTPPEPFDQELYIETIQQQAVALEKAFADFKLQVEVVDIQTGPVISQFELRLAKGLRLNKIQALADDLAISLKVSSARIVAPIPGKNTVGVELPNEHRQMVRLRDVMEQRPESVEKYAIPVYLGKDVSGNPMVIDLTKLPHLLIAGRTGTGKSVCLNSIIVSMLMTRSPEEVRMLMIDPKMVELTPYKTIPHLMHPVVTDMRKAEAILGWAVEKMEERYQLLAAAGVRQLSEYNRLSEDELRRRMKMEDASFADWDAIPKSLPYIVIIADEMADLMMTAAKEVETHIIRLAQKSRAVGIHLVLATQKPTVDIVTGLIKSNLPARIAFGVASRVDSQVVLDRPGAERLLGNGDMLFLQPNTGLAVRGQGTYVSDSEIESIIDEIGTDEPDFVEELVALDPDAENGTKNSDDDASPDLRDELYNEAVEYIIQEGRGSLSLLQRRFSIGYGRAARLIDFMEKDGVVGEHNGAQPREVLMTLGDWRRRQSGGSGPAMVHEPAPTPPPPMKKSSSKRVSVRRGIPIRPALVTEPVFTIHTEDDDYDPDEFDDDDEIGYNGHALFD